MAAYTRLASSNNGIWGSSSTWTPAGVPGAGDTTAYLNTSFSGTYNLYVSGNSAASTFTFNNTFSGTMNFKGGTAATPAVRTLSIGSGGIDMSAAAADVNFDSFCSVALTAGQSWNVTSGRTLRFDGIVSGAFTPTKSGAGTLVLTNANTYSTGTTISAGTVRVANNAALGTGTITMTGGALSSTSTTSYTLANALTLNGTMTLGDATNNGGLTFSGGTSIGASGADLTVTGNTFVNMSGALTGSGNITARGGFGLFLSAQTGNTWSGALTVNGANVYVGSSNSGVCTQLDASNATITITSGQLFFLGATAATNTKNYTGGGTLSIANAGGVTFNTGTMTGLTGTVQTYSDTSTSASSLARFANWPTAAGSVNNYSASTASGTHTLEYNGSASVGPLSQNWNRYATAGAQTMTFRHYGTSSATFSLSGSITHQSATNAIGLQFDVNSTAGLLTVSGPVSQASTGVFNVTKLGVGAMTLSGNNSFTGTLSVSAGTLNANSATALGADTSSGSVTSGATLSLGAALNYSTRNFTISGTGVSTGGALIHAFAGTAKIGAITLGAATYVRGTASGTSTLSSSIANGGFSLTAGAASGNTLTLTGGISGTGGLVVGNSASDTGTVALTTTNTYQGNTTLTYGTLSLGNASALGSVGALVFNGGTLDASTPLTVANALTVSSNITFTGTAALTLSSAMALGASRTITTNGSGGALTLSGVVSGATFKLTKAGTNTLVLTNTNTYSGGTDINAGTLIFSNGSLGSSGTITINGGTNSELRWAAGNTQGGSFSGRLSVPDGALNIGSNNVILALPFSSSTAIRFRGTLAVGTGYGGWATLFASNNTFTGDVYVESGALAATKDGSLGGNRGGGSFLRVESGACLLIAGITTATDLNFFRVSLNGAGTLSDYQETSSALYLATDYPLALGNISLVTSSTIAGEMTADLTSNIDTFDSSFVLTLRAIASKTARLSGIISGPGSVVINGGANTGTVRLSGASTYAGNTTVSTGTVQAGNTQALGTTGTVTLGASGTLQTLTTGGQNGKLTVAGLTNSAGGTIRIGG